MARIKAVVTHEGKHYGVRFRCLGCGENHVVTTLPYPNGWQLSGTDDRPTLSPSILVYEHRRADGTLLWPRCHSFVRDGRIEYLGDCTHALAGQTIDLPEIDS